MQIGDIGGGTTLACSAEVGAAALFAQAPVGLCEAALDGRIVRANGAFGRLTGHAPEALAGRHLNELVALEGADAWVSCVQLVLADHAPCSLHHTFVQPHGDVVEVHSSLSCFSCGDRPCGILLVSIDGTARGHAWADDAPAVISFERAGRLLESLSDVATAVDSAWRFTYVNAAAERFFKKDREMLLGQVCWDLFPELRAHPNSRGMERAMVERRSYAWESLSKLTGEWTQWRSYPLPDGGLFTLVQNIDDRVRAERALRASERLFQALADLVPPVIWTMDTRGNPQWCNQRWLTYVGSNSISETSADVLALVHPADRSATRTKLTAALAAGEPFSMEHRVRRADGVYRWFVAQCQPIADTHGEVTQWICVATEIHAQREALAAERSARADAEQTLEEVRRMFAELPLMLAVFRGPEHRIEVVTDRASRFFARPLVGLCVREAFAGADPPVFDLLDQVYASGMWGARAGVRVQQRSGENGDGDERLFDVKCHALKDASGRIQGVIAFGLDITDQLRAHTEAERQRNELARIFAQAPFAVSYLQGSNHVLKTANRAQRELIGRRDAIGLPLAATGSAPNQRGIQELLDRVYATGETIVAREQPIVWESTGSGAYYDVTCQAIRDDDGAIEGVLTFTVDVTASVRAREAAAAARDQAEHARIAAENAREHLRSIVAAVPTPLAVLRGEALIYELVNPAFEQLVPGRKIVGHSVEDVIPEIDPALVETLRAVYHTGEAQHIHELQARYDRDGQSVEGYFSSFMAPLRAADGAVEGIVTSTLNVTEQVEQRERVQALRREAETARAELEQAHALLETRIAERTAELGLANAALAAEIASSARAEVTRRDLLRRLATAREDEQRRTARDLHDQVGQRLSALMLAIKAACDAAPLPPSAASRLDDALRLAEDLGRDLHELARRLRPAVLDDLGLHAALRELLQAWSDRYQVRVDFQASWLQRERLPPEVETALYRVIQEAMTNVARHARATRVSVVVERHDGSAIAVVEDDGVGFDPATAGSRLGLVGMRERVSLAAGSLDIESEPGGGTTIIARVPLAADPAEPPGATERRR